MIIFYIDIDILMCSHGSLKEECSWAVFECHVFIRDWGFVKNGIWSWKLCFFEVDILSEIEKVKLWESDPIDSKLKIHNIHSLYNIVNPTSTVLIIGSCKHGLTDFEWHFITYSTDKSIRTGDSIIRVISNLWIDSLDSPLIKIRVIKILREYFIKCFISVCNKLLEIFSLEILDKCQ